MLATNKYIQGKSMSLMQSKHCFHLLIYNLMHPISQSTRQGPILTASPLSKNVLM
jgi:hypothetical protein